jgi:hypothetical protein
LRSRQFATSGRRRQQPVGRATDRLRLNIEAVDQPEPDEMTRLASFPAQIQAETKDTAEYDRKLY